MTFNSIINPIKDEMKNMKPTHIIMNTGTIWTGNGVLIQDADNAEYFFVTKDIELEAGEQIVWGNMMFTCKDCAILDFDVIANRMKVSK
jgi:hypothetical protein